MQTFALRSRSRIKQETPGTNWNPHHRRMAISTVDIYLFSFILFFCLFISFHSFVLFTFLFLSRERDFSKHLASKKLYKKKQLLYFYFAFLKFYTIEYFYNWILYNRVHTVPLRFFCWIFFSGKAFKICRKTSYYCFKIII